jgi:hypothetical protein
MARSVSAPRRPGSLQRWPLFFARRPITVFAALSVTPLPMGRPLVEDHGASSLRMIFIYYDTDND